MMVPQKLQTFNLETLELSYNLDLNLIKSQNLLGLIITTSMWIIGCQWLLMWIFSKLISNFCLIMCEFHVLVLTHKIILFQMKLRKARNVFVAFIIIWFNIIPWCMHKWVDQFGCHVSQFCLVIAIVMPMLLYRSWNLLKWTWFKDFNLNIYMMHKIIL